MQPAGWAAGTRPKGIAMLALTTRKEGASVEVLFKGKQQQKPTNKALSPSQYPVLSNSTAAKWQLCQFLGTFHSTSRKAAFKVRLTRLCGSRRNEQG